MRNINIDFYNQGQLITLGYTNEHLATKLNLFVPNEFVGKGFTYKLVFNLEDGSACAEVFNTYPIIYSVPNGIMSAGNSGHLQLSAFKTTENGETLVGQGNIVPFRVLDSLDDSDTNLGEYVDSMTELISEFTSSLEEIESKADKSLFLTQSETQLICVKEETATVVVGVGAEVEGFYTSNNLNHFIVKGTLPLVDGTPAQATKNINIVEGINIFSGGEEYIISVQNISFGANSSAGIGVDNLYPTIGIFSEGTRLGILPILKSKSYFQITIATDVDKPFQLVLICPTNTENNTYDLEFDLMIEKKEENQIDASAFESYYVISKNIANESISFLKLSKELQEDLENDQKALLNKLSFYSTDSSTSEIIADASNDVNISTGRYHYHNQYNNQYQGGSAAEWDCVAELIECNEGDVFKINSRYNASIFSIIECYNEKNGIKYWISSYLKPSSLQVFTDTFFIVPKGVTHIGINCYARVIVTDSEGNSSSVSEYGLKVEKIIPDENQNGVLSNSLVTSYPSAEFFGKSIYSDGDSIADGSVTQKISYASILASKYYMNLTSRAVGNTTLAVHPDNGLILDGKGNPCVSIYERVLNNISSDSQYDYIILDGGTNDITKLASGRIELGIIEDGVNADFNTSTILGALEATCKHLNTTQLKAKKLFIFVTNRVDMLKLTKEVFYKMKQVLSKWGIPYIDLSNINSLGLWNDTVAEDYFVDRIHPNAVAYKEFYLPYIEKALLYGGYIGDTDAYLSHLIDSKVNKEEISYNLLLNNITSTVDDNADVIRVNGKNWSKGDIVKIKVSADSEVADGRCIIAFRTPNLKSDDPSIPIGSFFINETASYIVTEDIKEFNCSIPPVSIKNVGTITMTVETLGLRENISTLYNKVEDLQFFGKSFSIIGDSLSAYTGWIPEGHTSYYNTDKNVTDVLDVSQMWWHILSSELKMPLLVNGSWMGTTMSTTGYKPKDENGIVTGPPADMTTTAFTTRAKSLFGENNTTSIKPDYILICGGTNDHRAGSPVGEPKYENWSTEDLKSVLPSFCYLIDYIKKYNPHAVIVNVTYGELEGTEISLGYDKICREYGIINVRIPRTDILNDDKLPGHPFAQAHLNIANRIISQLKASNILKN